MLPDFEKVKSRSASDFLVYKGNRGHKVAININFPELSLTRKNIDSLVDGEPTQQKKQISREKQITKIQIFRNQRMIYEKKYPNRRE